MIIWGFATGGQITPGKGTIELTKIKELRRGKKTEVWRRRVADTEQVSEELCLSLVYGNDYTTLDIYFEERKAYLEWYAACSIFWCHRCRPSTDS